MSDDLFDIPEPERDREQEPTVNNYQVGYGKPPKATRFKPGQSGNPAGRKKNAKSLKTIVQNVAKKKVSVRSENGTKKISQLQALVEKTMHDALRGDAKARSETFKLVDQAGMNDALADGIEDEFKRLCEEDKLILKHMQSGNDEKSA